MTKIMVTKRGGYFVPYGAHAQAQYDELPDGLPIVGNFIPTSRRSAEQNDLFWEVMTDLSKQVQWDGETLSKEEWRDLIIACVRKQKVVRGLEGGLVFLGQRSSELSIKQMTEVMDYAFAFGAQRGVVFTIDKRKAREMA